MTRDLISLLIIIVFGIMVILLAHVLTDAPPCGTFTTYANKTEC